MYFDRKDKEIKPSEEKHITEEINFNKYNFLFKFVQKISLMYNGDIILFF